MLPSGSWGKAICLLSQPGNPDLVRMAVRAGGRTSKPPRNSEAISPYNTTIDPKLQEKAWQTFWEGEPETCRGLDEQAGFGDASQYQGRGSG